jgi:hypothetical protein
MDLGTGPQRKWRYIGLLSMPRRYSLLSCPLARPIASTGLDISYETIRSWVLKFGPVIARRLRRRRHRPTDRWHLEEIVVRIASERMSLWRAVDHEGEVLDMLVQRRRNTRSARRRTIGKRHCGRMTADPALYLFRPRQLNLAMPCGELRCSWPEIRFLRLSRAAERLHWNNLLALSGRAYNGREPMRLA